MRLALLAGLSAVIFAPATAPATEITVAGLFSARDLSVWSEGSGFVLDTGTRFFGPGSWNVGAELDAETCILTVCAGAKIGASTSGRIGIEYGAKVNSGTASLQYPGAATFSYSAGPGGDTQPITIHSAFAARPGGLTLAETVIKAPEQRNRLPALNVAGPDLQAYVDLAARFHAFAGGEVCLIACTGPAISLDFDKSQPLAAINRNGSGEIEVLGEKVTANQSVSGLGGLVQAQFNIPSLGASSAKTPGGFDGTKLSATGRDGIASVYANLAQIGANAIGFPFPLSGDVDGLLGYNLLQAQAGLGLDLKQSITFTPHPIGSFLFSEDVIPIVGGIEKPATNRIAFALGDDITFRAKQLGSLSIVPTVTLDGTLENRTSLVVAGDLDLHALGINILGKSLGPLFNEKVADADLGDIQIYDKQFGVKAGSVTKAPFSIELPGCFDQHEQCLTSYFATNRSVDLQDGTTLSMIDRVPCRANDTDQLCFSPVSTGLTTSPEALLTDGGSVLLAGGVSALLPPSSIIPGAPGTDEDQLARLITVGYDGPPIGAEAPFVIPPGVVFDESMITVPEPSALLSFGLPVTALVVYRRVRGRAETAGRDGAAPIVAQSSNI